MGGLMNLAVFYSLIVFAAAIGFVFSNGILFALNFLGAAYLPLIAAAGIKWGLVAGDSQQKVGVPIVGLILLGLGYWLSRDVSLQLFGYHVSGLTLVIIGALVGFIAIPTAWGGQKVK